MPDNFDPSGANNLNAIRDRITKTLADATREMTPMETFANVGRAAARAATSDVTFGDALNAQKAERMGAAKQMMDFLQRDRQIELQESQLKISQEDLKLKQLKTAAEKGNASAKAVTEALQRIVPDKQRPLYAQRLDELPYEVDGSNVVRAISEVRRGLEAGGDLPPVQGGTKEEMIRRTMRAYPGISYQEAQSHADGITQIVTDPQTGLHTLVNKITGQGRIIDTPLPTPQQPQPAPEGQTLQELAESGDVAGFAPAGRELWSTLAGQIPGVPVAKETIQARQRFRTELQSLVRALANNPRFPQGEMERIRQEINIAPSAWDSREALLARMQSIDVSLRQRLANEERASRDISLPLKARQDAARAANNIRNFIEIMGVPQAGEEAGDALSPEDRALMDKYLQ